MVKEAADKRSINRLTCRLAIKNAASAMSIGQVEDISLDGMAVKTSTPLPVGSLLPVAIILGPEGPEIKPHIEIVRHTARGFGAKFVECSQGDMRKLRRYVADANDMATRQLNMGRSGEKQLAITRKTDIEKHFADASSADETSKRLTLLSSSTQTRIEAKIHALGHGTVTLNTFGVTSVKPGDSLLALHTHGHASYSFETRVVGVSQRGIDVEIPSQMYFSDRRGGSRTRPDGKAELSVPAPWRNNEVLTFVVHERSDTGLSIRVDADNMSLWPGTPLPGAVVRTESGDETLASATVRNLTAMQEPDGAKWLRVGISVGVERAQHARENRSEAPAKKRYRLSRVRRALRGALEKARYLYHKNAPIIAGRRAETPFKVVRMNNASGLPMVGLLNYSFKHDDAVRCPLIIITPGFAGRKETFSALAMTIVHNFRQAGKDVAVLRLDGTNNLGESYKAPGCELDGKHCMQYTLSGCVDDIVGGVRWARTNRHLQPTSIILLSSSLSSLAARKAMTREDMTAVPLWIALMGPPDGAHPVANAMGNSDPYKNYLNGSKNGVVTLFGCMTDGDRFCRDMHEHRLATLADSRGDMSKIAADVVWFVGKHDAFIDPERVEDVMSVKAPGKRKMVSVDAGHLPRTSDEAMAQFKLIVGEVNQHLYGDAGRASAPSLGWLAAVGEQEWSRVRKQRGVADKAYWKNYLVGEGGIGYDVWSLTPEYQQLMQDQCRLLDAAGHTVLDLGAGTGNVSRAVAASRPKSIVAFDLVQEALERAAGKVKPHGIPFETCVGSADGTLRVAVRRWLRGDFADFRTFAERCPPWHRDAFRAMGPGYTDGLHSVLRGGYDDLARTVSDAGLPSDMLQPLMDVRCLVEVELGRKSLQEVLPELSAECKTEGVDGAGLPFANGRFDRLICSLLLSYMRHPDDTLAEAHRVLREGGTMVISTMKPDAEGSQTYVSATRWIKEAPVESLPAGYSRQELLDATHRFLDNASDLVRMEEEGLFHFWSGEQLKKMVLRAGFRDAEIVESFGTPSQAVIVKCTK